MLLPAANLLSCLLKDLQLLLFTTVQLAQGVLLPYQTGDTIDAGASEETNARSNMLRGFCCIGCMSS